MKKKKNSETKSASSESVKTESGVKKAISSVKTFWREWLEDFYGFLGKLSNIKYHIKCLFLPWNVVKVKTLSRYYHDKDEIMLHACFQILVDFVEKEKYFKWVGLEKDGSITFPSWNDRKKMEPWERESLNDSCKIHWLYHWWKYERPLRKDPWAIEEDLTKAWHLDMKYLKEDQSKFKLLASLRENLWT